MHVWEANPKYLAAIFVFYSKKYQEKVYVLTLKEKGKKKTQKQKQNLTFQTPSARPPKLRAMNSNLGPRRSTLLSL